MVALLLLCEPVAYRARASRRKSLEGERAGGKSAHEKRNVHRARSGDHIVRNVLRGALADETVPRIRNPRIAAIRAERDLASGVDRRNDMLRDALFVALTVGHHLRTRNPEVREQLPCTARILAGDQACGLETLERSCADVSEIPYRCCDYMKHCPPSIFT